MQLVLSTQRLPNVQCTAPTVGAQAHHLVHSMHCLVYIGGCYKACFEVRTRWVVRGTSVYT